MSDYSSFAGDDRRGAVRYLHPIRQHWLLLLVLVVGSVATTWIIVSTVAKRYQATVDITVTPVSATDDTFQGLNVFRQSLDGSSTVVTAARVFSSPEIRLPATKAMGAQLGREASITIIPVSQADIVAIRATAQSAEGAAAAANIFAQTAISSRSAAFQAGVRQQISRIERQIAAIPSAQRATNLEYTALAQKVGVLKGYLGSPDPTLHLVAKATPPTSASWPRKKFAIAAAFIASLLLGSGMAVLLEVANPRISREEELQLTQRLPILARIPRLSGRVAHGYLLGKAPLPAAAWKGYRTLRAVLATAGPTGGFPSTILVTSASPGDGKTMTAVNLAITLAASDMRVILVDADLHRPMVSTIFHVATRGDGLTSVMTRRASVDSALVPAPSNPRLSLLLARREHVSKVGLFDATRVQSLLNRLREKADVIVIDSPPLPEVAEALELAAAVDAVLLAVRLGHTNRDRLNQLREMLARRGVSPVGLVVTTRRSAQAESPYDYGGEVNVEAEQEEGSWAERRATLVRLRDS